MNQVISRCVVTRLITSRRLIAVLQNEELVQIIDMGETAIDEETFDEYLDQMRDRYTADKVSSIGSYSFEYW